ncbi:MAG: hypothetical protein AMDU2_EPLC00007G0082 [Thermoplasmatales archaeon E-plasma]|jgi:hypothetical protein|nr:MAG: hypothetical protein AMDU2_EPLC00007G0082 [Thermoplasmatales archaeon E-plasma]EQB69917.1 MAG: hypothetical protein AMDU5_GPLC00001G0135 [Thermoplasmatales archaeon Gpl]
MTEQPNEKINKILAELPIEKSLLTKEKSDLVGDELVIMNIEPVHTQSPEGESRDVNLYTARNNKTDSVVIFFGSAVMDKQSVKLSDHVVIDLRISKEGRKYYLFLVLHNYEVEK